MPIGAAFDVFETGDFSKLSFSKLFAESLETVLSIFRSAATVTPRDEIVIQTGNYRSGSVKQMDYYENTIRSLEIE